MPHCHIVTQSHCHILTLPQCHTVTMSYCHIVTLSHSQTVILTYFDTMSHSHTVILLKATEVSQDTDCCHRPNVKTLNMWHRQAGQCVRAKIGFIETKTCGCFSFSVWNKAITFKWHIALILEEFPTSLLYKFVFVFLTLHDLQLLI